jgi:hypothetical protein
MERERTSLPLVLYRVFVYLCSNSLRKASMILEPVIERSHEAIRQRVQRLAPICDKFDVDRRSVRTIFVDETMVKIRGSQAWVWAAYEPALKVFLRFRISYNQSISLKTYAKARFVGPFASVGDCVVPPGCCFSFASSFSSLATLS